MAKIFVSTFPFCRFDQEPLRILKEAGHEIFINPKSRKLSPTEVAELASDCNGIVAGTEDLLPLVETSEALRIIARVGVGLDSVPLELCKSKGIKVAYTPDAVTPAVAELVFGLMLDLLRKITPADKELRSGGWSRPYGKRLANSTVGIVGLGRIGFTLAKMLIGFGVRFILIHDISDVSEKIRDLRKSGGSVSEVSKQELLSESDLITLHVPKDPSTVGLISSPEFERMKSSSYLINTARGGIVDEKALYSVLKEGRIAGAAIDVFEEEPYRGPLATLDNVLLTQHMGSCSEDCRADMEREACEDIVRFFSGQALRSPVS
ncbi:dehydrogenase [Leptospira fluminis]|uniref:Dehydrogenase n=1 Tax=Leptospira fluminis TaxID=2484979 RepID=A0A4R9GNW6_9LEPT|nr:phosphoglycerate dehydrogenase [Leptospira fluminis]TGK17263.1 dehydrogenase [Leptospira fluminis]